MQEEMSLGSDGKLECVDEFRYLGDMIGAGGGVEEASRMRVRCAWAKFRELAPILTSRGASLKVKGKVYRARVQRVMVYGSETWPAKKEDMQHLERADLFYLFDKKQHTATIWSLMCFYAHVKNNA